MRGLEESINWEVLNLIDLFSDPLDFKVLKIGPLVILSCPSLIYTIIYTKSCIIIYNVLKYKSSHNYGNCNINLYKGVSDTSFIR